MSDVTPTRFPSLAAAGGPDETIDRSAAEQMLADALAACGKLRRVLVLPPDYTRYHSGAGELTSFVVRHLRRAQVDVMPALGTHAPMSAAQIERMFPGVPADRILVHQWREGLVRLGEVPGSFVAEVSGGAVDYPIEIALDQAVVQGGYDLILSIGQVVPHEVIGMANQNKNLFVGVGGRDIINKSHYLGAAFGMERIMGRADTPVRRVFDYAAANFAGDLPICYALTVRDRLADGSMITRGLYIGDDAATYQAAAQLSQIVNISTIAVAPKRMVVWLDPEEYHSTWLGNKAIYRTRLAIADGGELYILAPGVATFGEDPQIDALIRRFGYRGAKQVVAAVRTDAELADNLSAAAHLIHGSSEGRFRVIYCPGGLGRAEVEGVGFEYLNLATAMRRFQPERLNSGWCSTRLREQVFYIANPALGLWARHGAMTG